MSDDDEGLGACCACGGDKHVNNIVFLPYRSPEKNGWGCLVCGLPMEGAVAVMCDRCADAGKDVVFFCLGYPYENRRAAMTLLTEPFRHDWTRHAEEEGA